MKCPAAFATALAMTACTSTQAPRPDTDLLAAQEAPAYSTEGLATPVQVDITPAVNAEDVVCRKTAPTGTRIAVGHCAPTSEPSVTQTREQMLRDIDEMRRRQWQQEALRQNAARDVLGGTPGAGAPVPQP
jgi:hypothetical protein